MNRLSRLSVIFITLIFTTTIWAWNFEGHVLIGQIAFNNLPPAMQKIVEADANALFKHLPAETQKLINYHYPEPTISMFAKTMIVADVLTHAKSFKNAPLKDIFAVLKLKPPLGLMPYLNERTRGWHFIHVMVATQTPLFLCQFGMETKNLIWAIHLLEKAVAANNSPAQQGFIFALLGHYIGDAHQPFHVLNSFDGACQGDLGGNKICIMQNLKLPKGAKHSCLKNLHGLWDEGLGYVSYHREPKTSLAEMANTLQQQFPASSFGGRIDDLEPQAWVAEILPYAPFLFNTPVGVRPSVEYYQTGQLIAQHNLALAGYRLAVVVKKLLSSEGDLPV